MSYPHKDLLGIKNLTDSEILFLLDQAKVYKEIFSRPVKQVPVLKGKIVMNLFYEPSTRTKNSFEQACRMLSCSSTSFTQESSSVKKGETLIDTAKNLEVLGLSAFVVRHSDGGAPGLIARNVNVPVINAGDGFNEHPTQGLLDVFTMREAKGDLKNKKVAIIGDIAHSRVARSNIWALTKLGAQVTVVAPPTLVPEGIEQMGVKVSYDLDEVIPEMDFLNVLRMQLERQKGNLFPSKREYFKLFGVTNQRLKKAKSDLLILHPGPINRGIEIATDVVDGSKNVILKQVTNGVAVRMAVLGVLLTGKTKGKKMKKILIKGGHVVDPANQIDQISDILIEGQKDIKVAPNLKERADEIIEAKNKKVLPGLIDMHVHFREPGQESKETIATGSQAGAAGGFAQVCCMANTTPPIDNRGIVELVKGIANREAVIKVHPIAAVTKQMGGNELTEMGELLEAGVVAFSDDGLPISNAQVMRRALEYAAQWKNVPIMVHEEDMDLVNKGSMNESYTSTILGLPGRSAMAEDVMTARDIELARRGGRIHFAHVSSGRSVELIRRAKSEGLNVTCETAPHYLTLTDQDVDQYNTHFKMAPPLRGFPDQKFLIEGIKNGTIDCIATDHAPHTRDDKNVEFNQAKFGIIGLETSLPVMVTKFVLTNEISWTRLVELMALNPARIMNLEGGTLTPGVSADLVIVDAQAEKEVAPEQFYSKGRNCPFKGWRLKGWAEKTFVNGQMVFDQKII